MKIADVVGGGERVFVERDEVDAIVMAWNNSEARRAESSPLFNRNYLSQHEFSASTQGWNKGRT
jgi:hypothetical protein